MRQKKRILGVLVGGAVLTGLSAAAAGAWPRVGHTINGDAFDATNGVRILAHSPLCCGSDAMDLFRASAPPGPQATVEFATGGGAGSVHFVEWELATAVAVRAVTVGLPWGPSAGHSVPQSFRV